jgi:hypothetical protein
MNDNIQRVSEGLRKGEYTTNPHQCAADLAILAGEFGFIMGQLELILQRKPAVWSEMRKSFKSDIACERAWESTADGLQEAGLRLRSKSVEKMMTALKSLIRIADNEAHNLH